MHKFVWTAIAATIVGVAGLFWAMKASIDYKPALPRGVTRNTSVEELNEIKREAREAHIPTPRAASKAVAPITEHKFGMLDPHSQDSHTFVIRNEGFETLRLGDPRPTCSCATAQLSTAEIAPGEGGEVTLYWTPEGKRGAFSVGAHVPTSDPEQPELYFRVEGTIRERLAASPNALVWGDIAPDNNAPSQATFLFSQVWEKFEIADVKCTMPGATWSLREATTEELLALQAKAAFRLTVELPSDLPNGPFEEKIEVWAKVEGEEKLLPYSMGLAGNVRGRISIHGSTIDSDGLIDLGTVPQGTEKVARLVLKVRDQEKELPNFRAEFSEAPGLTAQLVPQGTMGVYILEVAIPATAPPGVHLRDDQLGTLVLRTDHPRIPETKLRLRYAVTERTARATP